MIKRLSFAAALVLPSVAFAQTAVPIRPNHTLPQYGAVTAANSNADAPRAMLRMATPSATGGYSPLWPPGGLRKDTLIPSLYTDGSSGTLDQIGRMADGSVQQTDIGGRVAPLDANRMMPSPVSGDTSSAPATSAGTLTARSLSARFADTHNLADYGASLNGSPDDLGKIQSIYSSMPDGSVVHIPNNSRWNGIIQNPDPQKNFTWVFDKTYDFSGYEHPPGDGDTSLSHKYGLEITRMDRDTKNWRQSPLLAFYWNDDPSYCGAYCSNWNQQSAATFSAISGPTAQGNTSPVAVGMRSFGNNPSASYDVGLPVTVFKYGQNSIWGLDISTNDYSGKSPSAFATWNEFDMWTNGQDIKTWDLGYGTPQAGHRSVFYVTIAHEHSEVTSWSAKTAMKAHASGRGSVQAASLLSVTGKSGVPYLWYPVTDGTTGATQPAFPDPAKINGKISKGTLTVTRIVDGALSIGDTVTGANPISPVKITGQTSGAAGGTGVYTVDDTGASSNDDEPLYAAPQVADGNIYWQFGEELNSSVSSVLWVTASSGDSVDTAIGFDKNITINNAALDTTLAAVNDKAAVVRMASGQVIDFSGNGTRTGANRHTLDYENGALRYKVGGVPVLSIGDDGSLQSALPSRLPVMTRAQIRAYPSPVKGMEIYDSDDDTPAVYTGAGWKLMPLSDLPAN